MNKVVRNPIINLRALLFEGDKYWLAMGLERDIVVQGKTIDDTIETFIGMIVAWIHGAQEKDQPVFTCEYNTKTGEMIRLLPPAPREYHISYGRAKLYKVYETTVGGIGGNLDEKYKITVTFAIVRQKEDHPSNFEAIPQP